MAKEPDEQGLEEVKKLLRQLEELSADAPVPVARLQLKAPVEGRQKPDPAPAPALAVLKPREPRLVAQDPAPPLTLAPVIASPHMLPATQPQRSSSKAIGIGVAVVTMAAAAGGYLIMQQASDGAAPRTAVAQRPTLADTRVLPAGDPARADAAPAPPTLPAAETVKEPTAAVAVVAAVPAVPERPTSPESAKSEPGSAPAEFPAVAPPEMAAASPTSPSPSQAASRVDRPEAPSPVVSPQPAAAPQSRPDTTASLQTRPDAVEPKVDAEPQARAAQAIDGAAPKPKASNGSLLPRVKVPLQIAATAGNVPFSIAIEPPGLTGSALTVAITGLPSAAQLSTGTKRDPDTWALPPSALSGLSINLPAGTAGRHEVRIELQAQDGGPVASSRTVLVIAQAGAPAMADPERLDLETTELLMKQARKQLDAGQVAAARLLLQRAADGGHAEAALQLGDTFDPARLFHMGVRGISGDMEKAIYWYERADELGASQAKARLSAIGGR